MRHLFVVDPLESLQEAGDTSIAFMREAARRGHEVACVTVGDLSIASGRPQGRAVRVDLKEGGADWYHASAPTLEPLGSFDAIWMRKDPPVDLQFIHVTHLLSLASTESLVINDPGGIRHCEEKLFVLRHPEVTPESLVSSSIEELEAFRRDLGGEMIVKPIGGCGGSGVFHLTHDDRNVRAILEASTEQETQYVIAQRYLPEVREGDKRVIVLDGEPIGAVLRVPSSGESRANFHAGGKAARAEISERDREICAAIAPDLAEHGIIFAGIDVIGTSLTEVNVTSPTGIREINALDGVALERAVLDSAEAHAARRTA